MWQKKESYQCNAALAITDAIRGTSRLSYTRNQAFTLLYLEVILELALTLLNLASVLDEFELF